MSAFPALRDVVAESVELTADELIVSLADGRRIAVPLAWFPTLCEAPESLRSRWEFIGDGEGIHWPDLDADVSVEGLLLGLRE